MAPRISSPWAQALLCLLLLVAPALSAAELTTQQRQAWLGEVAEAVEQEQLDQAREILAQHPEDQHYLSWSWRGRVSALEQEWRAAEAYFGRALEQRRDYRPAVEGRIQALAMLEDWPALRRMIGPWLEKVDSPAAWWRAAAHAAWEDEDPYMAEDLARRGLARHPDDLVLRRVAALGLGAMDAQGRSIAAWRRVVDHPQASAEDWYHFSQVLDTADRPSQARQAMHIAHLLAPQQAAIANSYLAMLLNHDLSAAAYALAQDLLPASTQDLAQAGPERLLLAARSAEAAGSPQQAIAWLQAIDEQHRDDNWQILLARCQARSDNPQAALKAIESLIAAGRSDASLRIWAAQIAWQAEHLSQAESHLRAILASSRASRDSQHRSRMQLIRLLIHQQRHGEALEQVRLLRELDPYDRDSRRLEHYLQAQGEE